VAPLVVAIAVAGCREAPAEPAAAAGPSLTPEDRIAIEQLVARYPYALDTGEDEGRAYASLFTEDGEFVSPAGTVSGRDALAGLAYGHREGQGPLLVRNFGANLLIEPDPEGARGRQYGVIIALGDQGSPSTIGPGGHFEDLYVRTDEGWRIRSREFVPSRLDDQDEQDQDEQ
jgi:hypothetical protein